MVTPSHGHGQPPGGAGSAVGYRAVAQVRTATVWWPMDSLSQPGQQNVEAGHRPELHWSQSPHHARWPAGSLPVPTHGVGGLAQGSGSGPQGLCQPRPDVKCDTKVRTHRRCPVAHPPHISTWMTIPTGNSVLEGPALPRSGRTMWLYCRWHKSIVTFVLSNCLARRYEEKRANL